MAEDGMVKGTLVKKSLGMRGKKKPREVYVFGVTVSRVERGKVTVAWSSNYPPIDPVSVARGEPVVRQSVERVDALIPQPKSVSNS